MEYIINLTIVFDPENRLLMLRNNSQLTIGLSNPATRLLKELIKNNKIELTRETLIKRVWEDYGFSPSSATLSNHISELRKAFKTLGISKGILLTVPRIGFKMEAEIYPVLKRQKETESEEQLEFPSSSNEPMTEEDAVVDTMCPTTEKTLRRRKTQVLLLLLLALIALASVTIWMILSKNEQPTVLGVKDKCHFYTLDQGQYDSKQFEHAQNMLVREGIDCTKIAQDIHYMELRPTNDLLKVYFIVACTKKDDTYYKNCANFKQVE